MPEDTMRSRVSGSGWRLRILMAADRSLVAGGILLVVFTVVVGLLWIDPASLPVTIADGDPVQTLFQALLTAIITGVTLVVSINSLVISQELGAVGDQRERMEASLSYRDDVAELLDQPVSPATPSAFLATLLGQMSEHARDLEDAAAGLDDEGRDAVETYVGELIENAETVRADLEGSEFGTFEVLSAALDFNYSLKIRNGKVLRSEYDDAFDEDASAALDDVLHALEQYGPAREHVKTLYFQWELVDLSRAIMYSAVPALIVSIVGVLTLGSPGTIDGMTLGLSNHAWVVAGATTVAVAPFAILLSYILRIATIAKRTLAIGPFVLRQTDGADE